MGKMILKIFCLILLIGCISSTATNNDDNERLKLINVGLTDNQWKEILASYDKIWHAEDNLTEEDGDADPIARVVKPLDIAIGGKLEYFALKQNNFKFLSDAEYVKRIKEVFGIDLDSTNICNPHLRDHGSYIVYLTPNSTDEDGETPITLEFYSGRMNNYFFRKQGFYSYMMPLATIIDIENSKNKDSISLRGPRSDIFHFNNYLLHSDSVSLTWLFANGYEQRLKNWLYFFGYDKEERVNLAVMNDPDVDFRYLFASKDINGRLQIREGLLNTVAVNSTKENSKYYKMLEQYAYALYDKDCTNNQIGSKALIADFTLAERRKILAYSINTLQPLYEEFNPQCIGGEYGTPDKYGVGVTDSFWNLCFEDYGLIQAFKDNDFYGLANLKRLITKMESDERLINKSTGALEPCNFSSEHSSASDSDDEIYTIIDAYWLDEENNQIRDIYVESPITLYVVLGKYSEGTTINLEFEYEDDDGQVTKYKYSGAPNADGIIVIENFKIGPIKDEE